MHLLSVLQKYHFPSEVITTLQRRGIDELFPPQAEAIAKGVLDGCNLLMSVPTAAGKTLIAELCMLKSIFHQNGRCLYIAPLKALASEKYEDFKEKYEPLGVKVGLAIGDLDTPPTRLLNRFQILIATAEKVDSLLRSRASWLIESLNVVILDEIHFIHDGSRGPTMEILTARIKQMNPSVQMVALSATVNNPQEIAGWLKAELVESTWRPIPLKEGVYFTEAIQFDGYGTRLIREDRTDDLSKLSLDTLRGHGQVLIFVNSRRSAQAVSRQISAAVSATLKPDERKKLLALSREIAGPAAHATKICRKLAEVVNHGVAFHHAGLKPNQRKLIEDHFKRNLIKVICATPTLAAGVNLPARRVIIRDCKRYESGLGMSFIPTAEYKQCAGRAGRPQYDEYGEAVLLAKSYSDVQALFDKYIYARPESITSKLSNKSALRTHILSSISAGYVYDVKGMFEFLSHTFLVYQRRTLDLIGLITDIFDFLTREGFIEKSGFRFSATAFGQCTSRLYIDPITAILIRDGLKKLGRRDAFSPVGMLHLVCSCPDSPLLSVGKKDSDALELFAQQFEQEFIFTPGEGRGIFSSNEFYLATLKTTAMLSAWIEEDSEENICDHFGVGPGDIYRHVETAQWLLYTSQVMAELFQLGRLSFIVEGLRRRVHDGIREELLELASLKGIGRIRARSLYKEGFRTLADLKRSSLAELSDVPSIGKTLAKDILTQLSRHPHSKTVPALSEPTA